VLTEQELASIEKRLSLWKDFPTGAESGPIMIIHTTDGRVIFERSIYLAHHPEADLRALLDEVKRLREIATEDSDGESNTPATAASHPLIESVKTMTDNERRELSKLLYPTRTASVRGKEIPSVIFNQPARESLTNEQTKGLDRACYV